jgi:branched-chain amino acid transport system permease protein
VITQFWAKYRPVALLVLLAAAVVFPLVFSDPFITSIAVLTLIYAGASTSWNIFSGYTRYIALGHAVFFGVGAYALAIMCERWHVTSDFGPLLLLPLCGLFAVIVALPLGAVALRARSHTFVVITIAMVFIAQLMAFNLRDLTHGSKGFELPIPSWTFDVYNLPFYYGGLIILLLALATSWWIRSSKFGLGLLAIRDDEDRALGLGVRTGPSKLLAFVLSASFVGMLGGLWAYYLESTFPQYAFSPLFDVSVALAAFLGGIGTLSGPILGALILIPAQQYFASDTTLSPWYLVLYGGIFLVVILLLPEGIIPTARKRWAQWNAQRATLQPTGGGSPPPEPGRPAVAVRGEGGER